MGLDPTGIDPGSPWLVAHPILFGALAIAVGVGVLAWLVHHALASGPDARDVPPHRSRRDLRDRPRGDVPPLSDVRATEHRSQSFEHPAAKGFQRHHPDRDRPLAMQNRLIDLKSTGLWRH